MANKVIFGLERVHVALLTNEATGTYAPPIAIPGAVNLTLAPEGESSTFYADNVAYFTSNQNNGYTGELELALVADDVLADLLGWRVDRDGLLVEVADAQPSPFALLFEVAGNEAKKRYAFYKCIAARPDVEHETRGEEADPTTTTLSLVITPIDLDGALVVKAAVEQSPLTELIFAAWFAAVTKPDFV